MKVSECVCVCVPGSFLLKETSLKTVSVSRNVLVDGAFKDSWISSCFFHLKYIHFY